MSTTWGRVAAAMLLAVGLFLNPGAAVAVPAAAPPPAAVALDARGQLAWVVDASHRLPVSETELRQHYSSTFLDGVGGVSALNATLAQIGPLGLDHVSKASPTFATAVTSSGATSYLTSLGVDGSGLIDLLQLDVQPAAPTSWAAVDQQVRGLAPRASFAVDRIRPGGRCVTVHGIAANRPRALGSAFKLYVLGALGRAVRTGSASWDEQLAIRDAWKSLPSGELQDRPAGTKLTLEQYADYMIAISDNTATDHLLHRLGHKDVEGQLRRFGNAQPQRTTPFPTTRQLFTLKGHDYPRLAARYAAASSRQKQRILARTARVPRSAITPWQQPRRLGIEWFGSTQDICRAFAGLQRQAGNPLLAPVGKALSLNDGGLALDPAAYPVTWFKGGSEPGVLTLNHLVRAADGSVLVTSLMLENPTTALDEATVVPLALAIERGAIALADTRRRDGS